MKKLIFLMTTICLSISCSTDESSQGDDQSNDPNDDIISDFPINVRESFNDRYYVYWDKPQFNDTLNVQYDIYLNDNLFASNIDADSTDHFIYCPLINQNTINNGKVKAFDQYGNIKEMAFELDNSKPFTKSIITLNHKFRYSQFTKLNSGGYLSYYFDNGDLYNGYSTLTMLFYDSNMNQTNTQVVNTNGAFNFGGGLLPNAPYAQDFGNYAALDVNDGIFFISYGGATNQPSNPYIFKVDYSGNLLFTKPYVTNSSFEFPLISGLHLLENNQIVAYSIVNISSATNNFTIEYAYYDIQGNLLNFETFPLGSSYLNSSGAGVGSSVAEKFVGDGIVFTYKNDTDVNIPFSNHLAKVNLQGQIEWNLTFQPDFDGFQPESVRPTRIFIDKNSDDLIIYGSRDRGFTDIDFYNDGHAQILSPFVATINKNNGSVIEFKELFNSADDLKTFQLNTAVFPGAKHHPENHDNFPMPNFDFNQNGTLSKFIKRDNEIIFIGNGLFANRCEEFEGYGFLKFDNEFNLIQSTSVEGTQITNDVSPQPTSRFIDYIITENQKVFPLGSYITDENFVGQQLTPQLGIIEY